jgi:8-oxo-dGTP diphosphatase
VKAPTPAAGVVCLRGREVLLVRRGTPPKLNQWSLRELFEETGVEAQIVGLVDVIDALFEERHYVLVDYAAYWRSGEPLAGDDAAEARFWPIEEAIKQVEWEPTAQVIRTAFDRFGNGQA